MDKVKAVLMAWYPGQQGGLAVSEIITGKISPSGKLPISFDAKWEDNPSAANYHENVDRIRVKSINPHARVEYREGIFMGYRGYDKSNVKPLFPFGYGLSYTEFEYSDLKVLTPTVELGGVVKVSVKVTNKGKYDGDDVAQLYVRDVVAETTRPVRELKGFERFTLKAGEEKVITFEIPTSDLAYCHSDMSFKTDAGDFKVWVGADSATTLEGKFTIK
jgi:beta-glucosidase